GSLCVWRVRGWPGALGGGVAFIVPGWIVILALAPLFLSPPPPLWVLGAGAGAGAAVPAVAIHAGAGLTGASWQRRANTTRWLLYLLAGAPPPPPPGPRLRVGLPGRGLVEPGPPVTRQPPPGGQLPGGGGGPPPA